ncbi:MAG: hypothetical protein FWC32_01595 [Firmicutes bacterium]|nr:hypothetical protein [Bacillota bacterium]
MNKKRERHRQFWQPLTKGEGGYLAVHAPANNMGAAVPYPKAASVEEQWLSAGYRVNVAEAEVANMYYGQDAIHNAFVNLGPGVQAALLGAPYTLTKDSVWFGADPVIKNWDSPVNLKTNPQHELYKAIEEQTRALCTASKGRYAVAYTDIGGQYDVLYSLRGEDVLADLIEYPNEVMAAEEQLNREFVDYFNTLSGIIGPSGCGYAGWIPIISDVPWYPIQCDMSVMISPKMFEKFVLPSLDWVSTAIGQSIYHLDGPEQVQHLDMLLSLKHVHAIQWVPLTYSLSKAGRRDYRDYADELSINIYRRALAAGKKVVALGVPPDQVPLIYDRAGCDGVFIQTWCSTQNEADELITHAKQYIKN